MQCHYCLPSLFSPSVSSSCFFAQCFQIVVLYILSVYRLNLLPEGRLVQFLLCYGNAVQLVSESQFEQASGQGSSYSEEWDKNIWCKREASFKWRERIWFSSVRGGLD